MVCVDEIPTFQVLEREPIRRAVPGSIEQREFDSTRHGTVNMLVFLVVHSGLMELAFLERNDAEHYLPELELFRRQHQELRGVFLIQDGGSSHPAGDPQGYFAESGGWWRPRSTPANASWLNQAEILIHSFKCLGSQIKWNFSGPFCERTPGFTSRVARGTMSGTESLPLGRCCRRIGRCRVQNSPTMRAIRSRQHTC